MTHPRHVRWSLSSILLAGVLFLLRMLFFTNLARADGGTLTIPDIGTEPGISTTLSLMLSVDEEQVYSADLRLSYDSAVVSPIGVEKGNLVPEWMLSSNLGTEGIIIAGLAGSQAVISHGELLLITFQAIGDYGDRTPLAFIQGQLNEGQINTVLEDGSIAIVEGVAGLEATNSGPTQLGSATVFTASVTAGADVGLRMGLRR